MDKKTIGELIEEEVRKQNLSITDFAKMICCERANVYKIFQRNTLDIEQLARISKVLGRNFFEDIAKDYDLARPVEDEAELQRRKAITQMYDAVPMALRKIGVDAVVVLPCYNDIPEDDPLPDFVLSPFFITFSYGKTYQERAKNVLGQLCVFETYTDDQGHSATVMTSNYNGAQSCDIRLEYWTDEEWESVLRFAFDVIQEAYFPVTWSKINELRNS